MGLITKSLMAELLTTLRPLIASANPINKAFDFTQEPLPPLVLNPWPWKQPEPWSSFGTPPSASHNTRIST